MCLFRFWSNVKSNLNFKILIMNGFEKHFRIKSSDIKT